MELPAFTGVPSPLTMPITPGEVQRAISKLNSGRACGHDDLPADLLKSTADLIAPAIAAIFNDAPEHHESLDIGLYRDVWIAAIASSRKSLATQTAAICVRFHGRRVRHVYVTMQITFLARKSALIYRRGLRQRVASLTIDCNGVYAIRAYRERSADPSTKAR